MDEDEYIALALALGFSFGCIGVAFASVVFMFNHGTPQEYYRKSFDRTMECREKVKTPTDIDVICGKIPQWSEFVRESK